jgi:mono/diheme cytochrome c family protein
VKRALTMTLAILLLTGGYAIRAAQQPPEAAGGQGRPNPNGWQIPENAASEVNPIKESPAVLKKGEGLYKQYCNRCHGAEGTGNGEDANPDEKPSDLSDAKRAPRNPDGVLFYKVWNGRKKPEMPAFKSKMTKDEVWTLIHYVKTLRKAA